MPNRNDAPVPSRTTNTNLGHARALRRALAFALASAATGTMGMAVLASCAEKTASEDGAPPSEDVAPGLADREQSCSVDLPDAQSLCDGGARLPLQNVDACPLVFDPDACSALCGETTSCYRSYSEVVCGRPASCGGGASSDGRRPDGLEPPPIAADRTDLGVHFARMAYHEAAAATAFEQLAIDLRAHGAPASLLRALQRAAVDERRHAVLAGRMARRHGRAPLRPTIAVRAPRPLFDVALENAREGCGRELVGAAVGLHIAAHAPDPRVRAFFASIAADEVRHAAVSLRMQRWLRPRLTAEQRVLADEATDRTLRTVSTSDLPAAFHAPEDAALQHMTAALRLPLELYLANGPSRAA